MLWWIDRFDTCQNKVSWPYRGLKFTADRDRWPSAGFSIGSRVHVWLTCWKQGRIVRKPVNANPRLKVNRIITFSFIQMLLLLCFVYVVIIQPRSQGFSLSVSKGKALGTRIGGYWNSKQKAKQYTEDLSAKLQNSNQSSTFSWVSLIELWTTRSRSYAFRLA